MPTALTSPSPPAPPPLSVYVYRGAEVMGVNDALTAKLNAIAPKLLSYEPFAKMMAGSHIAREIQGIGAETGPDQKVIFNVLTKDGRKPFV